MEQTPHKTTINVLYIALILSTILSFVPNGAAQGISLILVIAVLACAYVTRSRDSEDGLLYNHMTYLIGTVWIGTGFIFLGCFVMGLIVYVYGDSAAMHQMMAMISDKMMAGAVPTEEDMQPYVMDYMAANKILLVQASLVAIGPAILYFVYRVANGYSRAMKGYRIAKPTSWL